MKRAVASGLPGTGVQLMMAPSEELLHEFPRTPRPDTREAAVLVILYPADGSVFTVLMQRPDYQGFHGGQISFPGGKKESYDADITATALREAAEETGIRISETEVIGKLTSLYIPVSNMLVTPVLAWHAGVPEFYPDPVEVVHLIPADLKEFLDPHIIKTREMEIRDGVYNIRYFGYRGNIIWGATAMMMNELLEIIRREDLLA